LLPLAGKIFFEQDLVLYGLGFRKFAWDNPDFGLLFDVIPQYDKIPDICM